MTDVSNKYRIAFLQKKDQYNLIKKGFYNRLGSKFVMGVRIFCVDYYWYAHTICIVNTSGFYIIKR